MSEKITVVIKPNGDTTVSVAGVKGEGCRALTAALEAALGTPTSDTATGEMYEQPENQSQNQDQS